MTGETVMNTARILNVAISTIFTLTKHLPKPASRMPNFGQEAERSLRQLTMQELGIASPEASALIWPAMMTEALALLRTSKQAHQKFQASNLKIEEASA